jgi:uncharacterized ferritin-like protein (DUF455 family)
VTPIAPREGSLERWAWDLVVTGDLALKRAPGTPPRERDTAWQPHRLAAPGRPSSLVRTTKRKKTPRAKALLVPGKRAELLHVFAHHELQAAELFAWAMLAFSDGPDLFVRGLSALACDEARHFAAYEVELVRLGHPFGSMPVRDWFWERIAGVTDAASFCAFVGLGLESANLDHTRRFEAELRAAGDERAAALTESIGREEIAHVRFAARWFEHFRGVLDLASFAAALPAPLSPMLFRGRPIDRQARLAAGWPAEMIEALDHWHVPPPA